MINPKVREKTYSQIINQTYLETDILCVSVLISYVCITYILSYNKTQIQTHNNENQNPNEVNIIVTIK